MTGLALIVLGLVAIVLVLSLPAAAQNQSIDSPEMLMQRLAAAMDAGDAGRIDRLHVWDGVDPEHATALRQSFETRFFQCQGEPARVIPSKADSQEYVRGGYRYSPNLPIEGYLEIRCAAGQRATFQVPYGRRDGQYPS